MSRCLWIARIAAFTLPALALVAQQVVPQKGVRVPPAMEKSAQGKISGVVVDAGSGLPLAHVQVSIAPSTRRDDLRTIVAGEDGRFLFENVGPGKYDLTAQRRGYLTQSFEQHGQYWTSVAVGPKLQSENLLFRLRRGASISGTVTDDQNEPLRNAEIMLFEETVFDGRRDVRARANTNDEGVYHFNHLPPGKYFVAASAEPWYAQRPSPQPRPLSRAQLKRLLVETGDQEKAATREEESTLPEQPQPRSPLDVAYPVTYYPGATDSEAATPIALSAGESFTADLNLRAVPALSVRIALPSSELNHGADVANVQIEQRLLGGFTEQVHSTSVPVEPGVVEVNGLVPGHYILQVNSYDGKSSTSSSKEVSISGDARLATDEKDGFVPVSGVVKLEPPGNLSDPGQVVLLNRRTGSRFFGQIKTQGEFEIDQGVPAGSYEVSTLVSGFFFKNMVAAPGRALGQILEIGPSAAVKLTVVVTQGVGHIDGVALKDETPVSGVMIVLIPQDPAHNAQAFRFDQSDSDGTFTLATVVPGKYTVVAIENGWDLQWGNPKALKPYMPQGTVVQVEPNGKYEIKVKIQQAAVASAGTGGD